MIRTERETDRGLLVTVCDSDALGETYERGEVSLEVTEAFYGGEEVEERDVLESLSRASVANLVGTRSVELAVEHGYVDAERVLDLGETLHAQFLRL
ncbi:MAG: DUF424 domain-containing protein [Halobacteriaceae archaeon]